MAYKAIIAFRDMQDGNYRYVPGDTFPRSGKKVSKKRIAELLSPENKLKRPVIEEVKEDDAD